MTAPRVTRTAAEVVAQLLAAKTGVPITTVRRYASQAFAALAEEGWAIYRPDECETVTVEAMNMARRTGPIDGFYTEGGYRLVPADSGGPE